MWKGCSLYSLHVCAKLICWFRFYSNIFLENKTWVQNEKIWKKAQAIKDIFHDSSREFCFENFKAFILGLSAIFEIFLYINLEVFSTYSICLISGVRKVNLVKSLGLSREKFWWKWITVGKNKVSFDFELNESTFSKNLLSMVNRILLFLYIYHYKSLCLSVLLCKKDE